MDAKIQISIDVIDLEEALALARASVKAALTGSKWVRRSCWRKDCMRYAPSAKPSLIHRSSSISRPWTALGWRRR